MQTILLVDDEWRIRKVLKAVFEKKGYRVISVPNIVEGREILKQIKIDLILLDINLGEFGGDILYEISRVFHQHVKIIISSVYSVEDQKRILPDAADYFDKSDSPRHLVEKVERVLARNLQVTGLGLGAS